MYQKFSDLAPKTKKKPQPVPKAEKAPQGDDLFGFPMPSRVGMSGT